MYRLTIFLVHLGCISPQSRSLYLCLTSIYVIPHSHQGPQIRISIPHLQFKCWELPSASVHVTYHLLQGNVMLVSPTSIQLSWYVSHLHQGCVSFINATRNESRFLHSPISLSSKGVCLNSIQVPSHPHPGLEICVSPPLRCLDSRLLSTSIQILMFVSHLHPCDVSPPSRPQKLHLSSI